MTGIEVTTERLFSKIGELLIECEALRELLAERDARIAALEKAAE